MSDGQTGQDADWSQRYAETGGWPPPAPDQQRYGPGTPGSNPAPDQPAPEATQPGPAYGQAQPGPYAAGPVQPPAWGDPRPGESTTVWGPNQDGRPNEAPWAAGDSTYGRLTGTGRPTPTPPPQRPQPPRRPWQQDRPPLRMGGGGTPITIGLIVLNVIVFLLQQSDPSITVRYGLVPAFVETGQYERLITSAFLHANFLHLATNMLSLYIIGAPLERVLRTGRYLTVYLLSALGGSLLSLWLSPQFSIGVGASGAIFGLFGALLILRRYVGAQASGLVMLIGLNLFISFAVPNISWQAHIGGLITGTLVALVFDGINRQRRRRRTT